MQLTENIKHIIGDSRVDHDLAGVEAPIEPVMGDGQIGQIFNGYWAFVRP